MSNLVRIERDHDVARVTLNRPELNNALNRALIEDLRAAFESIAADRTIATLVLAGEGKSLCAGADINAMREAGTYTREENIADAMPLVHMLSALDRMRSSASSRWRMSRARTWSIASAVPVTVAALTTSGMSCHAARS